MTAECNGNALVGRAHGLRGERRSGADRRRLTPWTIVRGGVTPRRRGGRRDGERDTLIDWHEPHLLALSLVILLLSVADAFMTLTLLMHGAEEANPVLAWVLTHEPELFALVKMTLTGGGVVVLVALARARVFNRVRVSSILHWCVAGYVALIGYEWWLFEQAL